MDTRWIGGLSLAAALLLPELAAAQAPRTLTVLRDQDADRYDPARTSARSAGEVIYLMSDTLVSMDYDQKTVKPGLATSWTVSADGKLYTFKLRDDVTFCDGRKMTSEDVAYSIRRWVDPATRSPVAWRAGKIKELRTPDPVTLEYELQEPNSELLYQLTLFFASVVDKNSVEKLGADFGVKGFNGTGPYCWVSWEPRNQIVLQKHPTYKWGPPIYANQGPAQIDRIVWKVIPEENTRLAALQTGQGDITQYIPEWSLEQLKKMPQVIQIAQPQNYFWLWFMGFKIDKPLVSDPKVRRAIVMGVDQKAIADGIFFGVAKPATSYVDPGAPDYDKATEAVLPKFDPEGAKKLLDEAGWKLGADGFRYKDGAKLAPLTYGFNTSRWNKVMEAVQGDLRKIGVDLQLQMFDPTIVWGKIATQEYDFYGITFPYFSAGDAFNLYFRSNNVPTPNRGNWKDPETDQWLDEGRAALTDEARFAAYAKAQRKIGEAVLWLPLVHEPLNIAATRKLDGVKAHGVYGVGLYKGLDLKFVR